MKQTIKSKANVDAMDKAAKQAARDAEKQAAENRRNTADTGASVGTGAAIPDRLKTIKAAAKGARGTVWGVILDKAAAAHKSAANAAAFKAAGVSNADAGLYLDYVTALYVDAARYADAVNGHKGKADAATLEKAENILFKSWKQYAAVATGGKVTADAADAANLYAAATRTARTGVTWETYVNNAGEVRARYVTGVAARAVASISAFQREVERMAVDRALGFDGVLSAKAAKDAARAAAAKRDKALAKAAPADGNKPDATPDAPAAKRDADKPAPAATPAA